MLSRVCQRVRNVSVLRGQERDSARFDSRLKALDRLKIGHISIRLSLVIAVRADSASENSETPYRGRYPARVVGIPTQLVLEEPLSIKVSEAKRKSPIS